LNIQGLHALATLFATYILATDGDSFYIIDQHAAHERVQYDHFRTAFLGDGDVQTQMLLSPYLFTPPAALGDLSAYADYFVKLGYEMDEFGENTWAVRSFPAFVSQGEGEAFLLESLAAIGDGEGESLDAGSMSFAAAKRIIARACKASVKANQILQDGQIKALLDELSRCENPYTCPHGRPVFLKLTRSDIERMFKRL
jgi:DNA mismatch repair protein MutL